MSRLPVTAAPTAALVLLADQVSKGLVRGALVDAPVAIVPGWLHLVHRANPDGALGLLGILPFEARLLLFGVGAGAVLAIGLALGHRVGPRWAVGLAVGAALGGAAGNLWDRVWHGAVTDVLVVGAALFEGLAASGPLASLGLGAAPAFNLADVALGVGLVGITGAVAATALPVAGRRAPPLDPPSPPG